jgi:uncharacterized membrane protein YedE/YeeE
MDLSSLPSALAGGTLIGLGIVAGALTPRRGDVGWRLLFVAGLVSGGVLLPALVAEPFRGLAAGVPMRLVVAGVLVGFGTRLANGCTSGHGVCGVGRLAPRSLVATATFMATGAVTVFVARHLLGVLP